MLWIGQLLSDTGTEIGMLAYPLLIFALTRSPVLTGVAGTAQAITRLCLQLPAGALAGRLDRRLTMIICDTMCAVLLALLGILIVWHLASWPAVLIVSMIEEGASAIFTPAATAALPVIVLDWRTGAGVGCPRGPDLRCQPGRPGGLRLTGEGSMPGGRDLTARGADAAA